MVGGAAPAELGPGLVAGTPVPLGLADQTGAALSFIGPQSGGTALELSPAKPRVFRKSDDETVATAATPEQATPVVMLLPIGPSPVMASVMQPAIPSVAGPPSASAPSTTPRAVGPGVGEAAPLLPPPDMPPAPAPMAPPPHAELRAPRAGDGRFGHLGDSDSASASAYAPPDPTLAPLSTERMAVEKPQITQTIAPSLPFSSAPSAGAARPTETAAHDMTVAMTLHAVSTGPGANQRITLKLSPVELGHVRFDIQSPAAGLRSVAVVFERADTMALFQQDQRHLALALDRAGLPTDPGQITFSLAPPTPQEPGFAPLGSLATTAGSSDPNGGQPSRGSAPPRPVGARPHDSEPEAAAAVAAYRIGPRTHLDIIA